mgnify:CR=1 FL=1
MSASQSAKTPQAELLGYLTYVDLHQLGTVGGILIVDLRARPIEFHCSSPVLPSRTQEILYGQTLRHSLICDQIGKSLLAQIKQLPQLFITDEPLALDLQQYLTVPISALLDEACEEDEEKQERQSVLIDHQSGMHMKLSGGPTQVDVARTAWEARVGDWDGQEPLERIREAISEAHRAAA